MVLVCAQQRGLVFRTGSKNSGYCLKDARSHRIGIYNRGETPKDTKLSIEQINGLYFLAPFLHTTAAETSRQLKMLSKTSRLTVLDGLAVILYPKEMVRSMQNYFNFYFY